MLSSILELMDRYRRLRIGQLLLKVCGFVSGLVFALIATLRDLFPASESRMQDDHRSIQDSDFIGDYNSRTQQFDSGTDPAGWYEDEP